MNIELPVGRVGQALAAGMLVLLLALIWIFTVNPLTVWYAGRAENLAAQTALMGKMRFLAAQLPDLQRQTQQIGTANIDDQFLAGATDAIAGAALEQIVQTAISREGASLSSAEVLDAQANGKLQRIQLRVTVSGTWTVLVRLVAALTTGKPVILIDDLQLAGPQLAGQPAGAPMDATFTVIAFRDTTPQSAAPVTGLTSSAMP